jgi:hypothetical protein
MCCFSQPVEHVSSTQIFARPLPDGRQYLVYSMNFSAAGELAMILPLPVPPRPAEDAVRFLDLSRYDGFFDDLKKAFPPMMAAPGGFGAPLARAQSAPTLKVHEVGLFEASFVPTLADFARLDARFRLSPEVWDALPAYRDYGFAVFKLKQKPVGLFGRLVGKESGPRTVHPMAFVFPRRDARSIFFPTVHVHDGEVHPTAAFDHTLYVQPDELTEETFHWEKGLPLGTLVDAERALGIVDAARPVYRLVLFGMHPNADVGLTPPNCAPSSLRRVGRCFELRIQAKTAYVTHPPDQKIARFREVARGKVDTLSARLAEGIDALVNENGDAWGLCPYDGALTEHTWNADTVYATHMGLDSRGFFTQPIPESGPLRVFFVVSGDRVEPQHVWLSFAGVPTPAQLQGIKTRLEAVLESVPL